MSAEAIARVIESFRKRQVDWIEPDTAPEGSSQDFISIHQNAEKIFENTLVTVPQIPVVDITPVYRDFTRGDKAWAMYEDTVARPPLLEAAYCYVNDHGNVHVMHTMSLDREHNTIEWDLLKKWPSLDDGHDNEWDRMRWVTTVTFWLGGYSKTKQVHMRTSGPHYHLALAVYDDGVLSDIRWTQLRKDLDPDKWNAATVSLLKALTILNCRNVEVAEPRRPRPIARRIERTGVRVNEIHIAPIGRYTRSHAERRPIGESAVPLSTVRGHVARYGPKYGRGLLFGKYEGEFWITPHLRGSLAAGEVKHDYKVE